MLIYIRTLKSLGKTPVSEAYNGEKITWFIFILIASSILLCNIFFLYNTWIYNQNSYNDMVYVLMLLACEALLVHHFDTLWVHTYTNMHFSVQVHHFDTLSAYLLQHAFQHPNCMVTMHAKIIKTKHIILTTVDEQIYKSYLWKKSSNKRKMRAINNMAKSNIATASFHLIMHTIPRPS